MKKYVLEMNEEQARITAKALDFYIRMRIGQWKELVDVCYSMKNEDYLEKKDMLEHILLSARNILMPELNKTFSQSYGVFNFEDTERAFNVMKAVRSCTAYDNHPEGGLTVDFDEPIPIYVNEPMPKCEVNITNGKISEEAFRRYHKQLSRQNRGKKNHEW